MALALDAHHTHPEPFTVDEVFPYRRAREPECQFQAMCRRKIMRKARSKKRRPELLAEIRGGSVKEHPDGVGEADHREPPEGVLAPATARTSRPGQADVHGRDAQADSVGKVGLNRS